MQTDVQYSLRATHLIFEVFQSFFIIDFYSCNVASSSDIRNNET